MLSISLLKGEVVTVLDEGLEVQIPGRETSRVLPLSKHISSVS